jgi:hypothetical protein
VKRLFRWNRDSCRSRGRDAMKIPNPRSKPPAENHREKGRDDVQVREKGDRGGGGGGGAAREGGDHNRARLRQHPHPRSLPPLLAALPPSVPTRRCVAWGARRERRGGDGTATSGKDAGTAEVGRLMALARPCRTHTDTRGPRGSLPDRGQSVGRSTAWMGREAWCVAWGRRHALVIVASGRSRVFPKVCGARPAQYVQLK